MKKFLQDPYPKATVSLFFPLILQSFDIGRILQNSAQTSQLSCLCHASADFVNGMERARALIGWCVISFFSGNAKSVTFMLVIYGTMYKM